LRSRTSFAVLSHLLFLALGIITRWNLRYEMLVSLLLACLVSFNISGICRFTIAGD
jgi:hypothetical protein